MAVSIDPSSCTVTELATSLDKGEVSARELAEYFLQRLQRHNAELNAVITVTESQALAEAEAADTRRQRGEAGPLTGIPILHKDIFCTAGVTTTCASRMLANYVPPFDATAVQRLRAAGMVSLGKCNMDEFAMGSSNESSFFGRCGNPWDTNRVPGGSSGGSAAAVAAGLAPAATGTDTGGSIRQPAAFCGITGLKPTYGRISRWGMVAFASSLDQAGPMAKSADDCGLLLQAMAGVDPLDATSAAEPVPDFLAAAQGDIRGLRIGLPAQYFSDDLDPAIAKTLQAALAVLVDRGAELVSIDLPHTPQSIATYYVIAPAEASANLSRYDGVRFGYRCDAPDDLLDLYTRSRSEGFGEEVQRRILVGTYVLSAGFYDAYYKKAQQVRRLISEEFREVLRHVDVIAGPAAPGVAFPFGAKSDDPLAMYLEDIYTLGPSLAGLPAMSLPAGFVDGLPVGLQLVGRAFDEATLLRVGRHFQQATDWHRQRPAQFMEVVA